MKVCIVSSCGGHLTEVRMLKPIYEKYEHFYVLNDKTLLPKDMKDRTVFIRHAERNLLVLLNFWEAWKILRDTKPDVLLSTGAGPVVPFAILARMFFKTRVVFVETITRIKQPSMTAKIMYYFSHDFFYQWEELKPYFPNAKWCGSII